MTQRPGLTPLKLTPKQLEEMAKVTDQDIVDANNAWRKHARGRMKDLLQTEPEQDAITA